MDSADILVLGAGAAGMMCAKTAAARGRKVVMLDHSATPCRKLLLSGGGKCNFTNRDVRIEHYLSANPRFCASALAQFTPADFCAWLDEHGIEYEERAAGQLFTRRGATHVVRALTLECARAGVSLVLGAEMGMIEQRGTFHVATSRGAFSAERLVVATGGLAYPQCGATSLGYAVARQLGVPMVPTRPGLAPLRLADRELRVLSALSGIAVRAQVRLGRLEFRDDLLFTHTGLSGPVALQVSSYWQPGQPVVVNLLPELDVARELAGRRDARLPFAAWLARHMPRRMAHAFCTLHSLPEKPLAQCSRAELARMADAVGKWHVIPDATLGYDVAEVTVGGVDTAALSSKTMEARAVPGLYFAGEVVDVTGQLGGYNLQWAWSSGFVAGQHA